MEHMGMPSGFQANDDGLLGCIWITTRVHLWAHGVDGIGISIVSEFARKEKLCLHCNIVVTLEGFGIPSCSYVSCDQDT
jgi:hypothetical protein